MNRASKRTIRASNFGNWLILSILAVFLWTASGYAAPQINLKVASGTVSVSIGETGDTIDLTAKVKNSGSRGAKQHFTEFVLSSDSIRDSLDLALSTVATSPIKARRRAVISASIEIPVVAIGAWNILACADASNLIKETNELDNCANIGAFEITAPSAPEPMPVPPTPTPTPSSSSIFSFSMNPVVLGNQPYAPSNEELLATWRTVTMTNVSDSTSPSFNVFGYGRSTSHANDGLPSANGDVTLNGPTYCKSDQTLAPGQYCTMSVYWSETQQTGQHTGFVDIYQTGVNPPVLLASLPVSQMTNGRPRFDVRDVSVNNGSNAYAGLVIHRTVILTNVGNEAISGTVLVVRAAAPAIGDGGFRINNAAGSEDERCTSKPTIGPGQTCEVRIEFCSTRVGMSTDGWQVFSTDGVNLSAVSPLATLRADMEPALNVGDTCAGYTAER